MRLKASGKRSRRGSARRKKLKLASMSEEEKEKARDRRREKRRKMTKKKVKKAAKKAALLAIAVHKVSSDKESGGTTRIFARRASLLSSYGNTEELAEAAKKQRDAQRERTKKQLAQKKKEKKKKKKKEKKKENKAVEKAAEKKDNEKGPSNESDQSTEEVSGRASAKHLTTRLESFYAQHRPDRLRASATIVAKLMEHTNSDVEAAEKQLNAALARTFDGKHLDPCEDLPKEGGHQPQPPQRSARSKAVARALAEEAEAFEDLKREEHAREEAQAAMIKRKQEKRARKAD